MELISYFCFEQFSITGGGGAGDSYYSSSRRGSVTSSGVDYAAILAAAAAVEAVNKATSHNATQNEDNSRISSSWYEKVSL